MECQREKNPRRLPRAAVPAIKGVRSVFLVQLLNSLPSHRAVEQADIPPHGTRLPRGRRVADGVDENLAVASDRPGFSVRRGDPVVAAHTVRCPAIDV